MVARAVIRPAWGLLLAAIVGACLPTYDRYLAMDAKGGDDVSFDVDRPEGDDVSRIDQGDASPCSPGEVRCDGGCLDATIDAGCEVCGREGEVCCAQTVDGGAMGSSCQADLVCDANRCARCPAGQSACDNQCVDTSASAEHCGACGQRCPAGTACARTDGGTPRCDLACMTGETVCGAACVATDTNVDHCGQCDLRCALRIPNAVTACRAGACQLAACVTGFDNCNTDTADGCEVNLRNDPSHCGACGNRCMLPHATAACAGGMCTIGMCEPGFADCNGDPADGCEVDLNTSVAHCSRCGGACPTQTGRTAVCVMGRCGFAGPCPAPTADCDGNQSCETTLSTSTTNCGLCGRACSNNNGAPECTNGVCATRCNPNFGDCDTNPANGCEMSLSTSIAHCGACGRACALARASTTCASGMCVIVSCTAGFADCDGNLMNGCETNTTTSRMHCGACMRPCMGAQMCVGGVCTMPDAGMPDTGTPDTGVMDTGTPDVPRDAPGVSVTDASRG